MILNRESMIPLTQQVIDIILERINMGIYSTGDKIPSQETLAQELDVSRVTIRRAVFELSRKGILDSCKGRGTTVLTDPGKTRKYHRLWGFSHDDPNRSSLTTTLLESRIVTDDIDAATKLGVEEKSEIFFLKRLRYVNNTPVSYEETFIPVRELPGLDLLADMKDNVSLYSILYKKGNISFSFAEEDISPVICEEPVSDYLPENKGKPIFFVRRRTFSHRSSHPFEYCRYHLSPDCYGVIIIKD